MAGSADERRSQSLPPEVLQAPWRDRYLRALGEREKQIAAGAAPPAGESSSCFLGEYWRAPEKDAQNHVIARVGEGPAAGMILLNKFPYANGHLLAALGDARPRLMDYEPEQRTALWLLVDLAVELAERTLEPQGVNVGVNQGRAAGAGVPEHLHAHVVPRWHGDVNFFETVGRTRVNPSALESVAARYRETWEKMIAPSLGA